MIKCKPILFSTDMVNAISDLRKTKTRRTKGLVVVNENPSDWVVSLPIYSVADGLVFDFTSESTGQTVRIKSVYGQPGDLLYVREKWKLVAWSLEDGEVDFEYADGTVHSQYFPDDGMSDTASMWVADQLWKLEKMGILKSIEQEERYEFTDIKHPFSPGIHLPKWGSRIWLKITGVHLERLNSISENDALAEGVEVDRIEGGKIIYRDYYKKAHEGNGYLKASNSFMSIWMLLNGEDDVLKNPWIWVIGFDPIDKPENL